MFMENNGSLIEGILSGVISGLIVGAALYLLTLWTEKRRESFKYKNSFNAKEINNIILKLREVNFLFFDNIELYVSNQDCFYYNIIAPINNCNFLEFDEIEREKVIDLFEMIDQWTSEALVLINGSRVYKKDRNVKKNFKKFSQSINQIEYVPIKDLQIVNNVISEYFLEIIGNKEENIGFEFQSNLKYKYEKIRNPKVYLRSEIEDKKRKVNEGNDFLKTYCKEYDVRKRKLKVNLSTKEYFYNKLFDKLKSSQV